MIQDDDERNSSPSTSRFSRRGMMLALVSGGATGLLSVAGLTALAGERPHQRLQDRSKKRNKKQRNKRQDNTQNDKRPNTTNTNTSKGGGLGGFFGLGTSVAFANPTSSTYAIRVTGVNGDVNYVCSQGFNAILSVTEEDGNDESAVTFIIHSPGWNNDLYIQAANYPFGLPSADYDKASNVLNPDGSNSHASRAIVRSDTMSFHTLDVGDSYRLDWEGSSFKIERQSDSSDYKMFLVTALA